MLALSSLRLTGFRNFTQQEILLDPTKKFIVIQGSNGAGKTSILEALYYGCYLRSFRTSSAYNLITTDADHFFFKINCVDPDTEETFAITVGSNGTRKQVKFNDKPLQTHKEILKHYRIVSLTEDDLDLIKGAPQLRRDFIAHTMMLVDPEFVDRMRHYRRALAQRNALLLSIKKRTFTPNSHDLAQLAVWTNELLVKSTIERQHANTLLNRICSMVNDLLERYFSREQLKISIEYLATAYDEQQITSEVGAGRTLWGLHLDDIAITLTNKNMKNYASRGQQKLVIFLFKVAQVLLLGSHNTLILLDDFITDFDQNRVEETLNVLKDVPCQVIISSPFSVNFLIKEYMELPLTIVHL